MKVIINKHQFKYALLFFIWLPARFFYGYLPKATNVMLVVRFILSIYILIRYFKFIRMVKYVQWLFIYSFCVIFSTVLGQGLDVASLFKAFEKICFIFSVILYLRILPNHRRIDFLGSVSKVGFMYLIGSLFSNINFLLSSGIKTYQNTYFFIGSRAESVQTEVLILIIIIIYNSFCKKEHSLKIFITIFLSLLDAIMFHSGQGITMIVLVSIIWIVFCYKRFKIINIFTPAFMVLLIVFLNYLVLSGVYQTSEIIVKYITEILGKTVGLTGRTVIFETAIQLINKSFFWGYGYNNTIMLDTIGNINDAFNNAHNSILDIILNTGIISFISLSMYIYKVQCKIYSIVKINQNICYLMVYAGIWVYYIGGLVNLAVMSSCFWILLAVEVNLFDLGVINNEKMEEREVKNEFPVKEF